MTVLSRAGCISGALAPAESYEQKRGNYKVKAPALVDERDSVAIKLFDNPQEQQQAMWRGLRRLLLLNIPSPIKYLHEKLPNKAKLGSTLTRTAKCWI